MLTGVLGKNQKLIIPSPEDFGKYVPWQKALTAKTANYPVVFLFPSRHA